MKAVLINSQNVVENVIVWQEGDVWHGNETLVVVDDNIVVSPGFTYEGGTTFTENIPVIPDDVKIINCKFAAQQLLQSTDWVTLSDITTGTHKLINQAEFLTYRDALRKLVINPVANPTWPTMPTEQWS